MTIYLYFKIGKLKLWNLKNKKTKCLYFKIKESKLHIFKIGRSKLYLNLKFKD